MPMASLLTGPADLPGARALPQLMRGRTVLASGFLPWPVRREILRLALGYELHPSSRIASLSWVLPKRLVMDAGARIGALTVVRGVENLALGRGATIGSANWIAGLPREAPSVHYRDQPERRSDLLLAEEAVIGSRNYIDCASTIEIGPHSRLDGVRSVILTHSIDIPANRQRTRPVSIGSHCLIGTNCVILSGARIADFCVVEAASLVTGVLSEPHTLYAGAPARPIGHLPQESAYGSAAAAAWAAPASPPEG